MDSEYFVVIRDDAPGANMIPREHNPTRKHLTRAEAEGEARRLRDATGSRFVVAKVVSVANPTPKVRAI
ncbi:MAG: hypothetical protein RIB60_07535 [Phycisphaerales bacterium]